MKAGWMSILLVFLILVSLQQEDWQKKTLSLKIIIQGEENTERFEYVQPNRFFISITGTQLQGRKQKNSFINFFEMYN